MKFKLFGFYFIVLSILLVLPRCYSYTTIPKESFSGIDSFARLRIICADSTEINTYKRKITFCRANENELVIQRDSTEEKIPCDKILEVQSRKFDYLGSTASFIASLAGILGSVYLILILNMKT